jgi:hypothetical protein
MKLGRYLTLMASTWVQAMSNQTWPLGARSVKIGLRSIPI